MAVFMALMLVTVSQVYTYLQTHQVVYMKYVQLFVCQPYLNNTVYFKKKEREGEWSHAKFIWNLG